MELLGLSRWEGNYLSDLVDAAKSTIKSAGRDPNDQFERIQNWMNAFGPVEPDQPFLRMINAYAEHGPVTVAFWVSVQDMTDLTETETQEFSEPLRKFTLNHFSGDTSGGFASSQTWQICSTNRQHAITRNRSSNAQCLIWTN